jgi:hypothetical protein
LARWFDSSGWVPISILPPFAVLISVLCSYLRLKEFFNVPRCAVSVWD